MVDTQESSGENRQATPAISPSAQQVMRLLIASYFLGTATGVVPYQTGQAFAHILLPDQVAGFGFTLFLFTTAFLILIGHQTRAAALLLGLFVFWASYLASFGPYRTAGYAEFWRDLALIGGLLLTYVSRVPENESALIYHHTRQKEAGLAPHSVTPRRVAVPNAIMSAKNPTTGATLSAARNHTGYAAFADNPDEMAEVFSEVFEPK